MFHVESSDGVSVAVHEFADADPLPPLLIAHATGFHAHCYTPIARGLGSRYRCVGLDFRGHGETAPVPARTVDWAHFGDDALAVATAIAPGGGLVGFGHSMGGAALLMAAHRRPALFERLVLFEPIVHLPSPVRLTDDELRRIPIIAGALRRRTRFASFDEAYHNFRSKPPMSLMVDEVLRHYVDHGFRAIVDEDDRPAVELRCHPELEARIFMTGRDNGLWEVLGEVTTPTVVLGGHVEEAQPSAASRTIADRLPAGRYVLLDHQTHFGPFSHPDELVRLIAEPV
ncbi:MAG TPA: alpha/beta hydrolase [Ilumatobacter sp.]